MGGAFQMSRDIFEHPIWQDITKFRIFFYIVGNAVFSKEGVRKGSVHIQRGQYLRSYRNLAKDLAYFDNNAEKEYSLSVIQRKIEELVEDGALTIEATKLGTLFTVVNYASYQGLDNYKNKNLEQRENSVGTAGEQPENNNKNVNNAKNEKKDKEPIPYAAVVNFLNEKSRSDFKVKTKRTRDMIAARWNEGHQLDDFYMVIEHCCNEWAGQKFKNGQMGDQYLRPSTLFNSKFDERLEWAKKKAQGNVVPFSQRNGGGTNGASGSASAAPKINPNKRNEL